jgi:hypothetical protein
MEAPTKPTSPMKSTFRPLLILAALVLGPWAMAQTAEPDLEATTPDGRRVVLKADGTWKFRDAVAGAPESPDPPAVPADLELQSRTPVPGGCLFQLVLQNHLTYEIRSLVPDFRVFRRGVVYVEQNVAFTRIAPGDQQQRALRVAGLDCGDIEKLQVASGDRCEMGELNKFTDGKGLCLARIRVKPSGLVKFEK